MAGNVYRFEHVPAVVVAVSLLREHPGKRLRITRFAGCESRGTRPSSEGRAIVKYAQCQAHKPSQLRGHTGKAPLGRRGERMG
jgi:hypothetical protein